MIAWLRRLWTPAPQMADRGTTRRNNLSLERLEGRDVPAAFGPPLVAVPYYDGITDSTVQLVNASDQSSPVPLIDPFPGFHGPLSAATGDVNGDGIPDLIVGAQAPDGHVEVFDGASGALIQSFFAFPGFDGTVCVGAADVNGDGFADVLVTASALNGHVKAFSGLDGTLLASFYAFPGFYGTTCVTGGDLNQDGCAEIIVGAGAPGVGGRVAIFNADGSVYDPGFFAFPGFDGPIGVACGDVTGDGVPDILVGAGAGAPGGEVAVYSGTDFALTDAFLPYATTDTGGVDVQYASVSPDGAHDIIVTHQGGGNPGLSEF